MDVWRRIAAHIAEASGEPFQPQAPRDVGGGCINATVVLGDGRRRYFVKLNAASRLAMFEAESAGLKEIAGSGALRVPMPLCHGTAADRAYLVMQYLELRPLAGEGPARAGRALAALHRHTRAQYGWERDNTLGPTPQPNAPAADWIAFWRERRLGFQLRLAAHNGYTGALQEQGTRLLERLPALIDHDPVPSLLHGDLWSGNIASVDGEPVVYDPAVYYGDRETDLAMSELFGGFSPAFYAAYRECWPLAPGYETRRTLYNLYHVLNHLNLFGGGYLGQARRMLGRLLAELG